MICCKLCSAFFAGCLIVGVGSFVVARQSKDQQPPAGTPEMKLPPGWTADDMKCMMDAATPGKMHQWLAQGVGTWRGKNTMWMAPDTDPIKTESSANITAMMDGRFTKIETKGDMPGMGMFTGFGLYGYDNVAQKFQSVWIDNMGTTMMTGTGELSSDNKTMTWNFSYTCPITKKPVTMREIDTITGPNSRTLEMWGTDPKSGKEFKCVAIEMTRASGGSDRTADVPTGR